MKPRNSSALMKSRTLLTRREALKGLLVGGAVAPVLAGFPVARALARGRTAGGGAPALALDVACLADTFRLIPAPDPSPPADSPRYGAPFLVEGRIYEGNTMPGGPGFDPGSLPAIGTWICRGWIIIRDERPEPRVVTTQQYLLGSLGGPGLFPEDQLFSEGLEGAAGIGWDAARAVVGGTGRFAGARGTVLQTAIGSNTTSSGGGTIMPAGPNFRFEFRLAPDAGQD